MPGELEKLKTVLVKRLVEKDSAEKWRYDGRYLVAGESLNVNNFSFKPQFFSYFCIPYTNNLFLYKNWFKHKKS